MVIKVSLDAASASRAAAFYTADLLRLFLQRKARVRMVAATAASQMLFHDVLTCARHIDWSRVELFHLDEYVGLPESHPASFRRYLLDRIIQKTGITRYHLLNAEKAPVMACAEASKAIEAAPIDLALLGIGENGHLAFNDPPANFETNEPYIVVDLDETSRQQQVNEGWFKTLNEVPRQAASMSIRQILKAEHAVCLAPDRRKAQAVQSCFENVISPFYPASILRAHPDVTVFLDNQSASLLSPSTIRRYC